MHVPILFAPTTMVPLLLVTLLCSLSPLAAANTLDVTDSAAVKSALSSAAAKLVSYYTPASPPDGAWPQGSDPSQVSWFESGMIWGAVLEYANATGDATYTPSVLTYLAQASFGQYGDFLHQDLNAGKWNDDIIWWALTLLAGIDMNGGHDLTLPSLTSGSAGASSLAIAVTTWNEVASQWDSECGGGIYWSRDRHSTTASQRNYKSAISNTELIHLSAHLFALTGNATYQNWAVKTINWLQSSHLLTSSGHIYDGMNVGSCNDILGEQYSYNPGSLLAGLAYLYATTSSPTYLALAQTVLAAVQSTFLDNNGIIIESSCEGKTGSAACARDVPSFKGQLVSGMAKWPLLFPPTSPSYIGFSTLRALIHSITTMLDTSAKGMAGSCDGAWNCPWQWTSGAKLGVDVHNQYPAVELLRAVYAVHFTGNEAAAAASSGNTTTNASLANAGSGTNQTGVVGSGSSMGGSVEISSTTSTTSTSTSTVSTAVATSTTTTASSSDSSSSTSAAASSTTLPRSNVLDSSASLPRSTVPIVLMSLLMLLVTSVVCSLL